MDNYIKISPHIIRKKKISFKELSIKKKLDNPYSEQEGSKNSILKKTNTIATPLYSKNQNSKSIVNKPNKSIFFIKSKRKITSNFHSNFNIEKDENVIRKNKKRKTLNLKKITDKYFTFLEEPKLFEEKVNHKSSFYPFRKKVRNQTVKMTNNLNNEDDNIKLFNITHLSSKSILKLNDIQKDLKKTIIRLNDNHTNIKEKKDFDNNDEEKLSGGDEKFEEQNNNLYSYRMLHRVSQVFDSLDDEDNFISSFYIDPNNKLLITIDILIFFFSIYHIIYLPLFLGYNIIYCRIDSFFNFSNILQIFIDIIYIIDCILSFFTASYTYDDVLKTDLVIITKEYLRSYFLIDFLSSIPFKTLFIIFDKKCKDDSYFNTPLYQNNIYYILVSLQLLKPLKVINKNHLFESIKNYLTQYEHFYNYFELYISVIIFLSCLHIVACIFIFIGKNQFENWILNFGFGNYNFYNLYFIAIYYIITTVTTVGYGDLSCVTPIEKIFGLFMEIVGIIAYSFALSSISNYVKEKSDKSEEFFQKCKILEDIKINYPNFSDDLYKRIYRYLKGDVFDDKKDNKLILNSLPASLKNDLVYNMYKPIIQNFFFFKNFNNIDFIVSVILSFKPIIALRNDVLMKHGDYVEDIIFVKDGRLSLDLPILIEDSIQKNNTLPNMNNYNNQNTIQNKDSIHKRSSLQFNNSIHNNSLRRSSVPIENIKMKINQNLYDENDNSENENINEKEEDYYEYYRILEIQKNEHFGDILMFLNKRSPLRVKVKSRKADLFYLKKNEAINISASFPHIWKKINKKSLFNWEQIKRLMTKVLRIFHQFQGLNFDEDNINENNYIIDTSITETYDLQSIPSSIDMTVDDEERTQLKLLSKNTQKNKFKTNNESISNIKNISSNESDYSTQKIINSNNIIESLNTSNENIDNTLKLDNENNEINSMKENKTIKTNYCNDNISEEKSSNDIDDDTDNDDNNNNKNDININNNLNKSKSELTEYYEESSNLVSCNSLLITPYKPNEINNEIYPNEDKIPTSFKSNYKLDYNLLGLKLRKDDDYSICSTEISFSIESEYDNINEISNYKYSKNHLMQIQCKNWIINFDSDDYKRKSILKPTNIKSKMSTSSVKFMNKELKRPSFINSKVTKKIQYNIMNRKSKFNKSNISKSENSGSSISNITTNDKKGKKNLLNVINQNIERNYINLNDPNLFYSEFFQKIIERNKIKDDIYLDSEDDIIKIFEKETLDGKNHKCPFKKFKEIIKKI